jgi:hypothetical protein
VLTSRKESDRLRDAGTVHGPDVPELDDSHSSKSTPTSNDDPKFTLFPELPIELRRMIWSEAADQVEPQTIKFTTEIVDRYRRSGRCRRRKRIRTDVLNKLKQYSYKLPMLLQVSREARETVTTISKQYQLCFEKELHGKPVCVNFARDTLSFESEETLLAFYGFQDPRGVGVMSALFMDLSVITERLPNEATLQEKELQHLSICDPLGVVLLVILPRFQNLKTVHLGDDRLQSIKVPSLTWLWREEAERNDLTFNAPLSTVKFFNEPPSITFLSREDSISDFWGPQFVSPHCVTISKH